MSPHEPNTTRWKPGDLVIADSDAKKQHMLMYVVEVNGDKIDTVYIWPDHPDKYGTFGGQSKYLHDPARFNIQLPTSAEIAAGLLARLDHGRSLSKIERKSIKMAFEAVLNAHPAPASSLSINAMVNMSYGTAHTNGWHDRHDEVLTPHHAVAQLAAATLLLRPWLNMMEGIRKPEQVSPDKLAPLFVLANEVKRFEIRGLANEAWSALHQLGEEGAPLEGSKTQIICWMGLAITELVEAVHAVVNGDKVNYAEELADTMIRLGDDVGAINAMPDHPLNPIDLEGAIVAKNERNKARGYRHGGKLA